MRRAALTSFRLTALPAIGADGDAFAHDIQQRPGTTAFGKLPGSFDIAGVHRQRDRLLENLLHIAEQAGLEFFAAKPGANRFRLFRCLDEACSRRRLVAERQIAPPHAFERPQSMVGGIRSGRRHRCSLERRERVRRFSFNQQQIAQSALIEWLQRTLEHGKPVVELTAASRVAIRDVGIGQRNLNQRAKAVARRLGCLVVEIDRLGQLAAARRYVAENLVGRPRDDLRILRLVGQCFARVLFGAIQIPGVVVSDREIALGNGNQVVVSLRLTNMQGLGSRPDAVAEFPSLCLRNGLAAVLVAIKLDALPLV